MTRSSTIKPDELEALLEAGGEQDLVLDLAGRIRRRPAEVPQDAKPRRSPSAQPTAQRPEARWD